MDSKIFLRHLLRAPSSCRTTTALLPSPPPRPQTRTFALLVPFPPHARFLSLPRIIQPTFWSSLVPKPFKQRSPQQSRRKEWNPATIYIIFGLLVGSQAIQTLWLKQDKGHKLRKAEAQIGMLEEIVRRVQSGEEVDVERMLGTGDAEREREWAEVIQHVKDEGPIFQSKMRRKLLRGQAFEEEEEKKKKEEEKSQDGREDKQKEGSEASPVQVEYIGKAKFY